MDCIFCRIAAGKIPAKKVYDDEQVMAFEDVNPQAPVHVLIIPKKHIRTSLDIKREDSPLIGHMFQVAVDVAKQKGVADKGFRLVMNSNSEAGQSVYHIHIHLLGGRVMHWPPG
jgi:histidine triad (HIT) family protein